MMIFSHISIKRKLTVIMMLTSVIVLLLASIAFIANELIKFKRSMVVDLATLAEVIGTNSTASLTFNDQKFADVALTSLKAEPHIIAAYIYTRDGKLFARYHRDSMNGQSHNSQKEISQKEEPPTLLLNDPAKLLNMKGQGHYFKSDHLDLYKPIVLDGETIGTICIRSDLKELNSSLRWYAISGVIIMLISSCLAYLLSSILQRVISEPILQLAETTQVISKEKNYSVRAKKMSDDELGTLIEGFNEMLTQIQVRDEQINRHREQLEDQVTKRTAELITANTELKTEIDQRKLAESALRESEEQFRLIFDNAADAIVWTNPATGLITNCNKATEILLEKRKEEIIGQHQISLYPPRKRDYYTNKFKKDMAALRTVKEETEVTVKSGKSKPVEISASMIFVRGESVIQASFRDITDRKRVEEEKQKAKEAAEEANRLKSQFLTNISHEIRTPLNCIIGFTEVILRSHSLETIHRQARTILQESETLLTLINDLLDNAKIEAGKLELEHRPMYLPQLLETIVSSAQVQAKIKGLTFHLSLKEDVPRYVIGDALRLRQVLVNLVSNAIKFTLQGEVYVIVERLKTEPGQVQAVQAEQAEAVKAGQAVLRFSVIDTGIGIPEEKQKTIFQSFTQVDGSTTRKYGGTGLGTTIAWQLVELMGGKMELKSKPGKGSTFRFVVALEPCHGPTPDELDNLPPVQLGVGRVQLEGNSIQSIADGIQSVADSIQSDFDGIQSVADSIQSEVDKDERRQRQRTGYILLAEDYPPNREIARIHIESAGYTLDMVENGEQAVEACQKRKFDLILMDVQMPQMDGYEATRLIRCKNLSYTNVPIIGLTAHAGAAARKTCLEAGMNDVITKPIRQNTFLASIDRWLTSDQNGPESANSPQKDTKHDVWDEFSPSPSPLLPPLPMNYQEAIMEFGENKALLDSVIHKFIENVEAQIPVLKEALEKKDTETLRHTAHKVRGGAANLTALSLAATAEQLETLAKSNKLKEMAYSLAGFEEEFKRLKQFVFYRETPIDTRETPGDSKETPSEGKQVKEEAAIEEAGISA